MFKFLKDKLKNVFKKIEKEEEEIVGDIKEREEETRERKGILKRIKERVSKKVSEKKFDDLFNELGIILIENNVAMEVVEKIKENLRNKLVNKPFKGRLVDVIKEGIMESINGLFNVEKVDLIKEIENKKEKPFIILFVGINGSGKTSMIAKIANLLKKNNLSCVLGAADSFRASAIEQLEEWGRRLDVRVIKHSYGSDPAAISFDTIKYAKARGIDVVLIDTAGRMHSNMNLIREMEKIVRVSKPDLKIFVGESIAGNDVIEQAKVFDDAIGIDAVILTKQDVDEKGGAAISISYVIGKPVIYLGIGQGVDDIKKFSKEEIIKNLAI